MEFVEGFQAASRDEPTVSVVIPTYNRAGSIRRSIDSVLRQTWSDLEVIVVDDGSTDETLTEVACIADPRLRVVRSTQNSGAGHARNLGVERARGVWVAFQDSDDEWLPRKLEKQMARLAAHRPDPVAVYCGLITLGADLSDGKERRASSGRTHLRYFPPTDESEVEGDLSVRLLRRSLISTQTLVARRELIRAIGGFDISLPALEDWDCAMRLARHGPIAFVDEPLVLQRFSADSISLNYPRVLSARIRIVEKHAALLDRYPDIHAMQHDCIATTCLWTGDVRSARSALARARALKPRDPRYWSLWLRRLTRALKARCIAMAAQYEGLVKHFGARRPPVSAGLPAESEPSRANGLRRWRPHAKHG
jgi:glycosyltransferase involved in cell wall biosynthesis